jgi:hypothetical protein
MFQRNTFGGLTAVLIAMGGLLAASMAAADEPARKEIVKKILDVELAVQESEPPGLTVMATGEVPTSGWENAVLVRVVYDKPPADGIQDYILFADRPSGVVAQVISRVVAKNTWKGYKKQAPWLKGVRIHGSGGGVVKMLP